MGHLQPLSLRATGDDELVKRVAARRSRWTSRPLTFCTTRERERDWLVARMTTAEVDRRMLPKSYHKWLTLWPLIDVTSDILLDKSLIRSRRSSSRSLDISSDCSQRKKKISEWHKFEREGEEKTKRCNKVQRGWVKDDAEGGRWSYSGVTEIRYNFPRQLRSLRIATNWAGGSEP